MELALHLAAARQVVADNRLVIGVEAVGVFGLDHDLVGLEQPLHSCVPFGLLLRAQFLNRLLVETGQQTHELFVALKRVLIARLLEAQLVRAD